MKKNRVISNLAFMLNYVLRFTPGYFVFMCLFEIYSAVEVFLEFTYAGKYLIEVIETGGTFRQAAEFMLFILLLVMIKIFWAGVMEHYVKPKSLEKLHQRMQMELYQKAGELDLKRYDNPECYNEFVWSIGEASGRIDKILTDLGKLCGYVTRVLVNGIFFLAFDKTGLLFVAVSLLITIWSNTKLVKIGFAKDSELKPIERKRNYFNRIFYLNDYAKEIRLNPIADRLKQEFTETNEKIYPIVKRYGRKMMWLGCLGEAAANVIVVDLCYLSYLIYQTVILKSISFGVMFSLFGASSTLKNSLKNFGLLFSQFQQHALYAEKIRAFLAFESDIRDGAVECVPGEFRELSLENVGFAYEGEVPVLSDISMTIHAGEKIAIVGYNGAGKTTLTKLLMRLYDVSSGRICVNGKDIREYTVDSYRGLYAGVFQDYKLFAASIAENVKMDAVRPEDRERIRKALLESGFADKLAELKNGMDTPLTREFAEEGVNLSGGEAQKVAIARTFYHSCPVIILDEPSSALDPLSEYQLNQTMFHAAENKTVIFISHRLSSTVMADRIYMLEQGRIIECGTHDELMRRNGKYAQMFRMQAEKYVG